MEACLWVSDHIMYDATSILFANYLVSHRIRPRWIYLYLIVYLGIEFSFLFANLENSHTVVM